MPADSSATKARILAAAERLFADNGFDGVSLRAIAREAKTQIALIHYHFESKEGLYRAVWGERYARLAEKRQRDLPQLDFSRDRLEVLRDLVDLFVRPQLEDPSGRPFLKIMAHEFSDPKEPVRGVVADYLDPVAELVLAGFRRVLPELSEADLGWGYQAMAGVLMIHVVDVDRTTRLSKGAARSGDTEAALPAICDFIAGGWIALAETFRRSVNVTRIRYPMPDDVAKALTAARLRQQYDARPNYQRNDYIGWIDRARTAKTREKRIAQMLDELKRGGVYMKMPHPASALKT
jgi:AcrR family transcriptional regulator